MMRITETVKQLIIINVIFFVATLFVKPAFEYLALYYPESANFKPWQIITHMFMHGSVTHILFNMLGLYMFGSVLEQFWGTKKFLFFYFSCGLGAAALHLGINYYTFHHGLELLTDNGVPRDHIISMLNEGMYNPQWGEFMSQRQLDNFTGVFTPVVGASGALYGLIVAFAFMFPNAELMLIFFPIPIKAKYFVPGLLAVDLFLGMKGQSIFGSQWDDGVAHFAHLGGALVGFIMMWYWKKNQFNKNRWD